MTANKEIYIKAYYGDWIQVTKEEAKKFCDSLMSRMQAVRGIENKIKIINEKHLKGITYQELKIL